MSSVATQPPPPGNPVGEPLSQLTPFNEVRFRQCIAYLSQVKGRSLSQLHLVQLSLLIDLFHILRWGKPVIGGSIAPWNLGPVVQEAYRLCVEWRAQFDLSGSHPAGLRMIRRASGDRVRLKASGAVDRDEFSQYEIEAMEQAWDEIGHLNSASLKHYTHSPDTFLGFAYQAAKSANRLMDWSEVVTSYDRFRGEDHAAIRKLIQLV